MQNTEQQQNQIQAVFNSFDTDQSGTIELAELSRVAQALGEKIPEGELKKIIKKLDTNKDGRISLDEFKFWWLQGLKGKLGKLVFLKAKSMKMTNNFVNKFKKAGVDLQQFDKSGRVDRIELGVSLGEQDKAKMGIDIGVYHSGSKFNEKYERLKLSLPQLNQQSVNIILILPSQNPQKAKLQIDQFIERLLALLPFPIQNLEDNPYAALKIKALENNIVIHVELKQVMTELVSDPLRMLDQTSANFQQEFYVLGQASLKTNFSFQQLIQEEKLIQCLLKGFAFQFLAEVPSSLTKKFRDVLEATRKPQDDKLTFLLSALLKGIKFKVRLNSPQMLDKFLERLGIKQIMEEFPRFNDLLELLTLTFNAEDIKQREDSPMHLVYQVLKFLKQNVNCGVQMYIQRKQTLFQLTTALPAAYKLFQVIFNEL